jgi:ATP-dependent Lon protease
MIMIITKKKYQEDIRKAVDEAVNRMEREQWLTERIHYIERECNERIEGAMRYVRQLEERLESIDPKIKETAGRIEWKACPICLRMRNGGPYENDR